MILNTFVFDIDGTICFDGRAIDKVIADAINILVERNCRVIFASARPIRDLIPVVSPFQNIELIGANGAMTMTKGEVEVVDEINDSDFRMLLSIIEQYNLDYVIDDDWNYSMRMSNYAKIINQIDPGKIATNVNVTSIKHPIKVILLNIDKKLVGQLSLKLRNAKSIEVIEHKGEQNIDITSNNINKFSALQRIGVKAYTAFGNDYNDLKMLKNSSESIWISSKGLPDDNYVKIDHIIPPNDEVIARRILEYVQC